jgi:hypothetical protein
MKTSSVLIALGWLAAITGPSSAADVRFRGAITVTSAKNCTIRHAGEIFNSAYMAAGSDGGHILTTSFSMVGLYAGDIYEIGTGGPFPKTWTSLLAYGFDSSDYFFTTRVRMIEQAPAVIDSRTQSLRLVGAIESPSNDPGLSGAKCIITFRAAYDRRL